MGQEIVTFSQVLTHPFTVAYICELCGEPNSFHHEIVGTGKKSVYRDASFTRAPASLTQKDATGMLEKAQKDLDRGVRNAQARLAKGKYSWIQANRCAKCKRYQSWHVARIWKDFFKNFFGAPFLLMLLVFIPLSVIYGKDSSHYPEWIFVVLGVLSLVLMLVAVVNLFRSLISRRGKQRNPPTVTL
jgi:hypothetical protein